VPAIVKPSRVSVAYATEPVRGGAHTTVSAHVLFDFAEPGRLLTEQALWPMVADQMPNGAVFDKGQLKPKAEVIIAGCALSPTETPIEATQVTARFGQFSKTLTVFGDRYWRLTDRGPEMSRPVPFEKMPIGDVQAFGGPNFAPNMRGKGHGARALVDAGYDALLPNVEDPHALIKSVDDMPAPAHFGPLPADDARRLTYIGTYDETWIKSVSPCKPDDFNPLYHCEAPEDQRFDEFFVGGETFSISGMSRGQASVGGATPRLRARCFYFDLVQNALIETTMRCDTVTLFPNLQKATMTFRGLVRGQDRFAEDISAIMVGLEDASAPARDPAYYADVFAKRTSKDEAHKYALSDFQLMPERDASEVSAKRQAKLDKAKADRDRFLDNQNWAVRKNLEDQGLPANLVPPPDSSVIDDVPLVGLPTQEELENGELDLAELLDDVKVLQDALMERQNQELAKAELQRRAIVQSLPTGMIPAGTDRQIVDDAHLARYSDVELDPEMEEALQAASRGLAEAKSRSAVPALEEMGSPQAAEDLNAALQSAFDELENGRSLGPEEIEAQFEKAVARALNLPEGSVLHDARQSLDGLDMSFLDELENGPQPPEGPAGSGGSGLPSKAAMLVDDPLLDEESKAQQKAMLDQLESKLKTIDSPIISKEDGANVLDDLMGVIGEIEAAGRGDLEGLSSAEIARKTMEDGKLRFEEAETEIAESMKTARQQSPAAMFPMEPLPEGVPARLGEFVRTKREEGHDFKGADLAGADLRGIDFSGCDLSGTFFENCELSGANFANANLAGAVFTGAYLDEADLSGTDLTKANFSDARMRRAKLDGAKLDDLVIIRSDFSGTSGADTVLSMVRFIECTLDGAAFTNSRISDLQVICGSAIDLSMRASRIERAMFVTLPLGSANFAETDLERIGFTEIQAAGSTFARARMLSVGFMGESDLTGSDFAEITAADSSWNTAQMAESCFLRARCNSAFFNACKMEATDFRLGKFQNTMFGKSVMRDSDFFGAHLFGASLTQTDLRRCSMRNANLYAANLLEAKLASCDFTGANLTQTLMEQPTHA